MNKNDQFFMAQKIRTKYLDKQPSEIDALRELDVKVNRPANVFAYVLGSIGAIVMGAGMSLIMTDIAEMIGLGIDPMLAGIVVGVAGMLLLIINYPIYKAVLSSRKKKYAPKILALSEKIINK